ncbi:MAG: glycerophosphodiester phosphodiesterase [Leptospiraceae bacterium]|nr:glycerophosphodiester phosphodiesterase [Leptospiraceae bacterium]MCP5494083.1 glycerophosphodiester phosphodiesterase [Leptospiraceae bacterium]
MKFLKYFIIFILFLIGIYFLLTLVPFKIKEQKEVFSSNAFRIAHRCGKDMFPENTLFACKKIVERNLADFLEMDVHLTKDDHLVVLHDATLDRTTNGTGFVKEKTYEEVLKLDAGYKFTINGNEFPFRSKGIQILELDEFFKELPNSKYYIEIKPDDLKAAAKLNSVIRKFDMEKKVVVGSFNHAVLKELQQLMPEVAFFASRKEISFWVLFQKLGIGGVYPFSSDTLAIPTKLGIFDLDQLLVENAKKQNIKIHVWTINEGNEMLSLIKLGVNGIMTDKPDLLNSLLDSKSK